MRGADQNRKNVPKTGSAGRRLSIIAFFVHPIVVAVFSFLTYSCNMISKSRSGAGPPALLFVLLISINLTGCQNIQYSNRIAGARVSGTVFGGQQPVTGSSIQLYTVGTTGDASAATPLISATVTTSDGS